MDFELGRMVKWKLACAHLGSIHPVSGETSINITNSTSSGRIFVRSGFPSPPAKNYIWITSSINININASSHSWDVIIITATGKATIISITG
jgi:hypothetical protein